MSTDKQHEDAIYAAFEKSETLDEFLAATPDRPLYTYDGHGINGPDEYRSRVATLTEAGRAANLGPLIASLLNDAFAQKSAS